MTDSNEPKAAATGDEKQKDAGAPAEPPPHFTEEVVTRDHTLTIAGTEIPYRSEAGRVILTEEDGKKRASFFYTAYVRTDTDAASRPITFSFNGGPGSSSVWLHMGAFGPKRVDLDDEGYPTGLPGKLVPNADSLLDVTDLVFIDPVGTGFSRAIPGEEAKGFHHFTRDIESVGEFIRIYLSRNDRWASPKFLAGESYGTTRAAGLSKHLLETYGLYLNGAILVSAILNFLTAPFDKNTFTFAVGNDIPYITFLPTYAATAWYHGKVAPQHRDRPLDEFIDEVKQFAFADYAAALLQGDSLDPERREAIIERLVDYTGLDAGYLRRYRLRIEILRFCKELLREEGRTVGRLDSRYTGTDRFADGDTIESDPAGDRITGQYAAMFNHYVRAELGYESDLPYNIFSLEVNRNWDYEDFKNANVDTSESLRAAMTTNAHMRVAVANGQFDLATPPTATEYTFDHMNLTPDQHARIDMSYYPAGHMMYVHRESREKLAAELRRFIQSAS